MLSSPHGRRDRPGCAKELQGAKAALMNSTCAAQTEHLELFKMCQQCSECLKHVEELPSRDRSLASYCSNRRALTGPLTSRPRATLCIVADFVYYFGYYRQLRHRRDTTSLQMKSGGWQAGDCASAQRCAQPRKWVTPRRDVRLLDEACAAALRTTSAERSVTLCQLTYGFDLLWTNKRRCGHER